MTPSAIISAAAKGKKIVSGCLFILFRNFRKTALLAGDVGPVTPALVAKGEGQAVPCGGKPGREGGMSVLKAQSGEAKYHGLPGFAKAGQMQAFFAGIVHQLL